MSAPAVPEVTHERVREPWRPSGTLPTMARTERARLVGQATLASMREGVRSTLRRRLASVLRSDPQVLRSAVELGLVRREWIDDPVDQPISSASPIEVVQRFLEREVERRPSILPELGLSTIQILASREDEAFEGRAVPVAIVFTDLEGFTRYTERAGDEAAHALLQHHARTVGPIVRSRGGRIVKRLGDGFLLTFPVPDAAVLAALELVSASPSPLRVRAGVHWGEAHELRDDIIGHDVNVAARVTDVARGDEVLTTVATREATRSLLRDRVEFGRVGRRKVKGLDEPVRVCRVRRTAPPTLELAAVDVDEGQRAEFDEPR